MVHNMSWLGQVQPTTIVPIWGAESNRWHRELLTPANLTCSLFKMTIVGAVARKAAILQPVLFLNPMGMSMYRT